MSWTTLLILAAGAYGFKAAGVFGFGKWLDSDDARRFTVLLPPALLAALVAVQTVGGVGELVIDARLPGVAAGSLAALRGAPFWAVVVIAAAVTAGLRALGWG